MFDAHDGWTKILSFRTFQRVSWVQYVLLFCLGFERKARDLLDAAEFWKRMERIPLSQWSLSFCVIIQETTEPNVFRRIVRDPEVEFE